MSPSSFSGRSVRLDGSERRPVPGATRVGPADPLEPVEVTLVLRRQSPSASDIERIGAAAPGERRHVTHEEYAARYGAMAADLELVHEFARAHGLTVVESDAVGARVVLGGPAAALAAAFEVELGRYEAPGLSYRGREDWIHVPEELSAVLVAVLGLDDRPAAWPPYRVRAMAGAAGDLTPPQVARRYDFPQDLDGSGQCVAIVELGGGYRVADLTTYFDELDVRPGPITAVSVDGGHNHPGRPSGPDGEVMLDIEIVASVATGASVAVYFAPNTDRGFVDALSAAVHDAVRRPSVVSISWGAAEEASTPQLISAMGGVLQAAAALGVTVCCASGDHGSGDRVADGRAHVDFPASHPYALACGGTSLAGAVEVAWNDGPGGGATGGGVSAIFPLPDWQSGAGVPANVNDGFGGRGVPDVAANADPASGYRIRVDGKERAIGGTSAVAPLMAALIAMANQRLGRPLGFVNPLLYTKAAATFNDVTEGTNGAYDAGPGWDPCTGLGSPDGAKLVDALTT